MSVLDQVIAAVTPPESDEARQEARAKARAVAGPGGWFATILDHHLLLEDAFAATKAASDAALRTTALKHLGVILSLLAERAPGATICPSGVARKIAGEASGYDEADWRTVMTVIHAAIDHQVEQGNIRLSWKGRALSARSGPYRIARANGSSWDSRK